MINSNNPLLPIAKRCLSNNPDDCPPAYSISQTIHGLMKLQFAWCVDLHAECAMSRCCNAIANIKGIIYLSPATSTSIYAYDSTKDRWSHV